MQLFYWEDNRSNRLLYAHLSDISVEVGDIVFEGDNTIGMIGDTGEVVGGRVLHFEVLESLDQNECVIDGANSKNVNPQDYLLPIRTTILDYLSQPFAIGLVPGDVLGTMSAENLTPDQRYERNLDLKSGEAYLRKLVNAFSTNPNSLKWDKVQGIATVKLNSKTKYYSSRVKYKNARHANNRMIVNVVEFMKFFYSDLLINAAYPGGYFSIAMKEQYNTILKGTYFDKDLDNYAEWFYSASKKYSINPYYLVAKALIEGGASNKSSTNPLLVGYKFNDGTTVYNFFGIGASDGNATANGANYAKNAGWTTPQKAIKGGAKFIEDGYISIGQDTPKINLWYDRCCKTVSIIL